MREIEVFEVGCAERWGFEREMKYRIKCGWMQWREVSSVIYDKRIPIRL